MSFVGSLLGIIGFLIGFPIGLFLGFFFLIHTEPTDVKNPVVRLLQEFDSSSLLDIIPELPLWVKSPDYERVDWMNVVIGDMWPYLDKVMRIFDNPGNMWYHKKHGKTYICRIHWHVSDKIHRLRKPYAWNSSSYNSSGASKKPVGILHVKVVRARNLLNKDFLGASDPYVQLSFSGDRIISKSTSVKMNDLNPEWNEDLKLSVKDPESQVLELHVYDWEKVGLHDKLGMQVIPLKFLSPHETKEFTLDLLKNLNPNDNQNKKPRGNITVELTLTPFVQESMSFNGPIDLYLRKESVVKTSQSSIINRPGLLSVTIIGAEDVEGKHHTNPYALVIFKGEQKKTKLLKKTRDPIWNEEFQFMLEEAPLEDTIHVEVISKHRRIGFGHSKEPLGHVNINLIDVVYNGRINEKYHLINSRNGIIHIDIRWNVT